MKRIFGRAFFAFIFAFAFVLHTDAPASAQAPKLPDGIELGVEAGAGGVIHMGRVNPFTVLLANKRETEFHGAVEISSEGVSYRRDVSIAPGDASRVRLYVDLDQPKRDVGLFLKDARERTIYQAAIEIKTPAAPEDAFILVADSGSGLLSFLDGTPVLTARRPVLDTSQLYLQQGKLKTAYTTLANLIEAGPQYLASVDALVIRSGDFSRISSENLAALQGFVAAGGALVTTTGVDSSKLAQSKLSSLVPAPQPSVEPVSDFSGLETFGEARLAGSPVVLAGSGGKVSADAEVLVSNGERALIAVREYGLGRVVQINFDVGDPSLRAWAGWERAWSKLLQPAFAQPGVNKVMLPASKIADIIKDIPQSDPVPLRTATLFIFIYIVLVGPVNYALLARKKKRTLLWLSIPIVIVAFTMFGVMLGYMSRGTDNIMRQLEEIHVFEDVPVALVRSYTLDFPAASGEDVFSYANASAVIRAVDPPPHFDSYNYYGYGKQQSKEIAPRRISYSPLPSVVRRSNKWTPYLTWWDGIAGADFGSAGISGDGKSLVYDFAESPGFMWLFKDSAAFRIKPSGANGVSEITAGSPGAPTGIKRNIAEGIDEAIFTVRQGTSTGKLGSEPNTIFAYFKLDKPEVQTSRKYDFEAGRLLAFHPKKYPNTQDWARTKITVSGFTSKSGNPSMARGWGYGYEPDYPIVNLNEGDEVEFEINYSPLLAKSYRLKIYTGLQDRWSSSGTPEFEFAVSSGRGVLESGKASGEGGKQIQAADMPGGKLYLKITATGKISVNTITLQPE